MLIISDVNQTIGSHAQSNSFNHRKLTWMGHTLFIYPLPFGDYIQMTGPIAGMLKMKGKAHRNVMKEDFSGLIKVAVDRKNSISEVCGNICSNTREHERFRKECVKAKDAGAKFYVLIEDDTAKSIEDVFRWNNPRRIQYFRMKGKKPGRPPADGKTLAKAMLTMEKKYGVKFLFCRKHEAAEMIVKLLGGDYDERKEKRC